MYLWENCFALVLESLAFEELKQLIKSTEPDKIPTDKLFYDITNVKAPHSPKKQKIRHGKGTLLAFKSSFSFFLFQSF